MTTYIIVADVRDTPNYCKLRLKYHVKLSKSADNNIDSTHVELYLNLVHGKSIKKSPHLLLY